ncbi:TetR/AcrR family transcriptional regulator [Streptomyces sp. H39-S7]|uniref:TetR/AcrR family transcriptional regulator n=1 Tax=Streptomyces sp. H39-S7 TaxID=3004357 RepID=UPI0022B056D6|nr:TetR/AcrR family transcriptional regulator [Streptomyces sp. H39-S7]MCZ4123502.1 TetR/AcrR family transcriptional regulator [Streptomyces sp. H39-S7]
MAEDSRGTTPAASVWLRERPAGKRRSEQPAGLDRDRIVATTVRLLDSGGLATFSMRRLAAELGVTAMSVYWYVDTKDDLLERVLDAVHGEIELPPEEADADWRDEVRELARGYRAMLVAHPWTAHLIGTYPNIGPLAADFANLSARAMARSGLAPEQQTGALGCVLPYVYGFGAVEVRWGAQQRERDFTFGLDCVIAGIEAMRDRHLRT